MSGLFSLRYPINPGLKVWTERRFRDLCGHLGSAQVRSIDVIVPAPDLFRRSGSAEEKLADLFEHVCRWMEVVPDSLHLRLADGVEFVESFSVSEFSVYQRVDGTGYFYDIPESDQEPAELVMTSRFDLDDESMLAIIARGVAQHVLRTRLPNLFNATDRMQIADLLPIFFGLGIFVSNATLHEGYGTTRNNKALSPAHIHYLYFRLGYLSSEVYGYANALFAWVRGETEPVWATGLRLDSRETMNLSLKYLDRTADCIFESDVLDRGRWNDSQTTLEAMLEGRMPTWQVYALMELKSRPDTCRQMVDRIIPLARSRNQDVRVLAIQALAMCLGECGDALRVILRYCQDRETQVRLAVATSLRPGTCDDQTCLATLMALCADPEPVVSAEAAGRLLEFPDLTDDQVQPALNLLRTGDIRCNTTMMVQALRLLERVCDDVPGLLCSEFDANSVAAMKVLAKDIPGIEFPGQDQVAPADAHEWQDAGNQGSD